MCIVVNWYAILYVVLFAMLMTITLSSAHVKGEQYTATKIIGIRFLDAEYEEVCVWQE